MVYCSSIAAYGSTAARQVAEETPLHPANVYAATKAAGEQLVEAYRHRYGISTASLRLVAVFGPRRQTDCLIRTCCLTRPRVAPPGSGCPPMHPSSSSPSTTPPTVLAAVHATDAVGAYNVAGDRVRTAADWSPP